MPRHKKDLLDIRSREIKFRVTEAEYLWLKLISEKENTNMSELLRRAVIFHIDRTLTTKQLGEYFDEINKRLEEFRN